MPLVYKELARGSQAEGSVGFAVDGARGATGFVLMEPTKSDLQNLPKELLGGVNLGPRPTTTQTTEYAGIRRFLPKRHPWGRSLVVTAINGARGVGLYSESPPGVDIFLGAVQGFPLYEQYEVAVEFSPPQYNLRPDSSIKTTRRVYHNHQGTAVYINYANEWTRYLDWNEVAGTEVLTSKFGQMFFHTATNALPGAADITNAAQYQGTPYQTLPDSVVKMAWYQVPLSFVTSQYSYLRNCPLGVINQFDWFDPNGDGVKMFPAGSLRYGGYSYKKYLPPIPAAVGEIFGVELGLDTSKLCDIELTFYRTTRQRFATDLPAAAAVGADANPNWLVAGWNLQPWLQTPNKYYYTHAVDQTTVASRADKTKWYPHHLSFPFELFFTDPDAAQPDRANMLEVKP